MTAGPAFVPLDLCVLTVSDTRTPDTDTSGDCLALSIGQAGHRLHDRRILKDNRYQIRALVAQWIADDAIHGVLVTGGTGFTGRDSTPEAILPLARGSDGRLGVRGGGGGNPIVFNVQARDADSFRRSEAYLTGQIARAVARGQRGF